LVKMERRFLINALYGMMEKVSGDGNVERKVGLVLFSGVPAFSFSLYCDC